MELVEIRDLDGPNVFLLRPAIKVELKVGPRNLSRDALRALRRRIEPLGITDEVTTGGFGAIGETLAEVVRHVHRVNGEHEPELTWRELEEPGHVALAFAWSRRAFALEAGKLVADVALGVEMNLEERQAELSRLHGTRFSDDEPGYVRDADRNIPILGVTGTNGKTTTTRLCAHILRIAGRRVGWTTTAGVFIDGVQVLDGDYTGPQGAHRVLAEPGLDVAVLETARGGILLRGLAYESNDVAVLLNVSSDHLGLLGIRTVEGLAEVKSIVLRVTRAEGFAVLNADDPLVRGIAGGLRARLLYFSRDATNPTILNHVATGGAGLAVVGGSMVLHRDGRQTHIVQLGEVPMTFAGRAPHMVENALGAAAACLSLGVGEADVAAGLRSFRNTPEQNGGRLNVFDVDGVTVIVDYAHNEAGLEHLLRLGRAMVGDGGRLVAVIGTAGDRSDESLRTIGKIAGSLGDEVVIKETQRYLRGRATAAEMSKLMAAGVEIGGNAPWRVEATEIAGLESALNDRRRGDVVALMCIEQLAEVLGLLSSSGRLAS